MPVAVKLVLVALAAGLLFFVGPKALDKIDGDQCRNFLDMSHSQQNSATAKVLRRSGHDTSDLEEWRVELVDYCESHPNDNLDSIDASYGWGGWRY